jgi:hypothetical protein
LGKTALKITHFAISKLTKKHQLNQLLKEVTGEGHPSTRHNAQFK